MFFKGKKRQGNGIQIVKNYTVVAKYHGLGAVVVLLEWLLFLKIREITGISAQVGSMTEPREPLQQPLSWESESMAKHSKSLQTRILM